MIENVGNLICLTMFDLGEKHRVVVISTIEDADKALKYFDMFYYADVVVINKTDLIEYVDFDIQECIVNIKKIRSDVKIFELSVKTGASFDSWFDWLRSLK